MCNFDLMIDPKTEVISTDFTDKDTDINETGTYYTFTQKVKGKS